MPVRIIGYRGFDVKLTAWMTIQEFMSRAGEMIKLRAQSKLGTYQAGWPPLAASTLRKKRRQTRGTRVRMQKRGQVFGEAFASDTPLIDKGKMARSFRSRSRRNKAYISADFPMNIHEQDWQVGEFDIPPSWKGLSHRPRRPVLGPALDESLPQIVRELEESVARRLSF